MVPSRPAHRVRAYRSRFEILEGRHLGASDRFLGHVFALGR
jgi:hypothetical protein